MMIDMKRQRVIGGFPVHVGRNREHIAIDVNDFHRMSYLRTRYGGCHHATEQQRDHKDKASEKCRHRSPPTMEMATLQCGRA